MEPSTIQGTEAAFRRVGDLWICGACGTDASVRRDNGRLVVRCRACKNWAMSDARRQT